MNQLNENYTFLSTENNCGYPSHSLLNVEVLLLSLGRRGKVASPPPFP